MESQKPQKLYSISEVAEIADLPASTIRFYEREFYPYLKVQKTPGGHRRFDEHSLQRLLAIKTAIKEGKSIKTLKRDLLPSEAPHQIRREADLLLEVVAALTREHEVLRASIASLGDRLKVLEGNNLRKKSGRGFFRR